MVKERVKQLARQTARIIKRPALKLAELDQPHHRRAAPPLTWLVEMPAAQTVARPAL